MKEALSKDCSLEDHEDDYDNDEVLPDPKPLNPGESITDEPILRNKYEGEPFLDLSKPTMVPRLKEPIQGNSRLKFSSNPLPIDKDIEFFPANQGMKSYKDVK